MKYEMLSSILKKSWLGQTFLFLKGDAKSRTFFADHWVNPADRLVLHYWVAAMTLSHSFTIHSAAFDDDQKMTYADMLELSTVVSFYGEQNCPRKTLLWGKNPYFVKIVC